MTFGSTRPRRANRRDANESGLIKYAKARGAGIVQMQPGHGFDLLILFYGAHIVEVKNPAYKWKLEPDEIKFKALCDSLAIPYNIVEHEFELVELMDDWLEEWIGE